MNKELEIYQENIFESIKHIDETGNEFWYARELMKALKYSKWENFRKAIDRAKIACKLSGNKVSDCFPDVRKPIKSGKGKIEMIEDYKLTRYACYLIVQNGDSRKQEIALGQTYFAVQTRKMEITEEQYMNLSEDERRLFNRMTIRKKNLWLFDTARKSGVKNYGKFNNFGYMGLYNGETADDIAKRKRLDEHEDILDWMESEELGANIFRITQTDAKLKRDKINNEEDACDTHYQVGTTIRNAIASLGGTMPEDLPTPEKSIERLEQEELLKIKGGSAILRKISFLRNILNF